MKIFIITARVAPIRCGVGDHSVLLGNYFTKRGDEVVLLTTRQQSPTAANPAFEIRNVLPNWGFQGMKRLWREIIDSKPDVVVLQWVPFLYGRRGCNLLLPLTAFLLSKRGVKIRLMVHEPWVDFLSPYMLVIGLVHRFAMMILVAGSSRIGVSIQSWTNILRARFPWRRNDIETIPAFSNIEIAPEVPSLPASFGIPPSSAILGVFSLYGSAKGYRYIEEAWDRVLDNNLDAYLVVIGASVEEANKFLPRLVKDARCRFTGYLKQEDVSAWLQSLTLLIAPFMDGVSGRRGSVLAALSHGVPVVSTRGKLTDGIFLADNPLILSHLNKDAFSNEVVALLQDKIRQRKLAQLSKEFYERNFSLEKIAEVIVPRESAALELVAHEEIDER